MKLLNWRKLRCSCQALPQGGPPSTKEEDTSHLWHIHHWKLELQSTPMEWKHGMRGRKWTVSHDATTLSLLSRIVYTYRILTTLWVICYEIKQLQQFSTFPVFSPLYGYTSYHERLVDYIKHDRHLIATCYKDFIAKKEVRTLKKWYIMITASLHSSRGTQWELTQSHPMTFLPRADMAMNHTHIEQNSSTFLR